MRNPVTLIGGEAQFAEGTVARCNRCAQLSPLPRAARAVRENARVWRLMNMVTLSCGHLDTHWVFDVDLESS